MTEDERQAVPLGEPVPELRVLRERTPRRVHEETSEGSLTNRIRVSLNFLATRFTCSWPWSTMVLLCDGRLVCGCADPYGRRVLGDYEDRRPIGAVWTGETASALRRDLNAGGSKFCGDCPLKLPLKKDHVPPRARPGRLAAAFAALHREHRRLQHLVRAGLLRAGDRHHPHPSGRHARLRAVQAGRGRSWPVARPNRLLQLRRSVPAQARRRDVRVHQEQVPAHLSLHQHQRPGLHRGTGPAAGSVRDRRGHVLDRWRDAGELRQIPAPRGISTRRSRTCASPSTKSATLGRDVPFINWRYILFTHNDSDAEMQRARQLAAEIGVDRLCWELTDHPEDLFSQAFPARHTRTCSASGTRSGTTTTSATRFPAPRRALRFRSAGTLPGLPLIARHGRPLTLRRDASATHRRGPSRRRPATAAAWSGSAPSCAPPRAR